MSRKDHARPLHLNLSAVSIACIVASFGVNAQTNSGASTGNAAVPVAGERIEVRGAREAHSERRVSAQPILVTNTEELERFSDATVGDVLRRLVGMSFTGPAGVVKDIRMRGLDKGFTQFLINGEPLPAGKQDRALQVDRLPADMIERVEILRSANAEFASDGIAGTINIVLKSKVDGATRMRVTAGKNGSLDVGDAIVQWSGRLGSAQAVMGLSYTAGAEDVVESKTQFNAAGAIASSETKPKPAKKDEWLFTPSLKFALGSGQVTLDAMLSDGGEEKRERPVSFSATGAVTKRSEVAESKTDRVQRVGLKYESLQPWGLWSVGLGQQLASDNKDKNTTELNAAGVVSKRSTEVERGSEEESFLKARLRWQFAAGQSLRAGLDSSAASYRKNKTVLEANSATAPLLPKAPGTNDVYRVDEDKTKLYLQHDWSPSAAHALSWGARHEITKRVAVDRLGGVKRGDTVATNPSANYRFAPREDWALRLGLNQTTKPPKFDELNPLVVTATGAQAGSATNPDKGGNPDLAAVRSRGFDLGGEHYLFGGRGVVGLNLYGRDVSNFVEKLTRQEGTRFVERPYNVGDARFWGVEFDLRYPLLWQRGHRLAISANHSWHRGEVRSAKTGAIREVKDMPKTVSHLGLDWNHSSGWAAGFSYSVTPAFTRNSANDDNGNREIKSRNKSDLLDAYLSRQWGSGWMLRMVGKNLTRVSKIESTRKFKANGQFDSDENKAETSKATMLITLEYRF